MIDLSGAPIQRHEKYRPREQPKDHVEAFIYAMAEYGLDPLQIEPSGKLVRFDIDKKGDKAGWYVFHVDEISAGSFGSWKTGVKQSWCSKNKNEFSIEEQARYKKMVELARLEREREQAALHASAMEKAAAIWAASLPVSEHAYLDKKAVLNHGLRLSRDDLVVQVLDSDGVVHNLQFIKPNGDKKFLFGGRVEGCSFTIPGGPDLYLCEGYATGATIHAATGGTVICCFNAGNIEPVALEVRRICPDQDIVICADNDRFTGGNPGIKFAENAAKRINASVVFPVFNDDDETLKHTDFNDLAKISSIDAVKTQIKTPNKKQPFPYASDTMTRAKGRVKARPAPIQYCFMYNDQGLIPGGVVGVLTATGGTGKTYFLLALGMAGAGGPCFGPIRATRPMKTLIVLGEDTQEELDRRSWDICKGDFPELFHTISVYGEVGPLMALEGGNPVLAGGYTWLEQTIIRHPGLELLILDPKSRFYGLDENNNDHSTRWVSALEHLAKKYCITILFSAHTGKQEAERLSQNMNRGGSAIVDGCRWQAGLVNLDKEAAQKAGIKNRKDYIVFGVPKSNYAPGMPSTIIYRRGNGGILEYVDLEQGYINDVADYLYVMLEQDYEKYTRLDLVKETKGREVAKELKEAFPGFRRKEDMEAAIFCLLKDGRLNEKESSTGLKGRNRFVLTTEPF